MSHRMIHARRVVCRVLACIDDLEITTKQVWRIFRLPGSIEALASAESVPLLVPQASHICAWRSLSIFFRAISDVPYKGDRKELSIDTTIQPTTQASMTLKELLTPSNLVLALGRVYISYNSCTSSSGSAHLYDAPMPLSGSWAGSVSLSGPPSSLVL